MTEPTELPLTGARREMLERVADQLVTYETLTGRWHGPDGVLGGWAGRTLSELRRAEYILILASESTMSTVDLTERGRTTLSG